MCSILAEPKLVLHHGPIWCNKFFPCTERSMYLRNNLIITNIIDLHWFQILAQGLQFLERIESLHWLQCSTSNPDRWKQSRSRKNSNSECKKHFTWPTNDSEFFISHKVWNTEKIIQYKQYKHVVRWKLRKGEMKNIRMPSFHFWILSTKIGNVDIKVWF